MNNIITIPFIFDRDEFNKRVKIELYEGMEQEIEGLLDKAIPLISPKAIFIESSLGDIKDKFTDDTLLKMIKDNNVVFPYVVTCGIELENLSKELDDMLVNFWLDALKQMSMDRAFNSLRIYIKEHYNIDKLYSINPGSDSCGAGWIFEEQKNLFSLFPDITEKIGVTLTESLLMHPNKTISGIIFESNKDFVSCDECKNIDCPNRRMIHDGAVIFHE